MNNITENLITWYQKNKRDLPWRHTKNPYFIWISEIMLQQTRVEAVKVYYERFIKKLPTLKDLAEIEEDELLKLWEGLGYYSRVRNMQKTAKILVAQGKENLPNTKEELLLLPGIGKYTLGAILSIAFDIPTPAIDGNVYRILGRIYKIDASINKSSTYKIYEKILTPLLPNHHAGEFTQSFMDLGSAVCTPKSPKCRYCPLQEDCLAYKTKTQENYPVKEKKKKQTIENRTVYLFIYQNKIAIQKRKEEGLLASLYEFPNTLEEKSQKDVEEELKDKWIAYKQVREVGNAKHVFSHIIWMMKAYQIVLTKPINKYEWVTKEEIVEKYSIPSAFSSFTNWFIKKNKKSR